MMAKPMKTLELHYPMIQFLIISDTPQIKLRNICSRDMFRPVAIARAKILFFHFLFVYLFFYLLPHTCNTYITYTYINYNSKTTAYSTHSTSLTYTTLQYLSNAYIVT